MVKYLKPQTPLQHYNGDYIYPITSADQVLVSNGERLNANLINVDFNSSDNIPETVLKPQNPMIKGSDYFYPLTTSDQIIMPDGTRLDTENIGNGMKMELLWENAKPRDEFAEQDIIIGDCSQYDYLFIYCYLGISGFLEANVGASQIYTYLGVDDVNNIAVSYTRTIELTSIEKIHFLNGYQWMHNGSYGLSTAMNNFCMIPYKIYGIKGVN